jgi:hypothetical protein
MAEKTIKRFLLSVILDTGLYLQVTSWKQKRLSINCSINLLRNY